MNFVACDWNNRTGKSKWFHHRLVTWQKRTHSTGPAPQFAWWCIVGKNSTCPETSQVWTVVTLEWIWGWQPSLALHTSALQSSPDVQPALSPCCALAWCCRQGMLNPGAKGQHTQDYCCTALEHPPAARAGSKALTAPIPTVMGRVQADGADRHIGRGGWMQSSSTHPPLPLLRHGLGAQSKPGGCTEPCSSHQVPHLAPRLPGRHSWALFTCKHLPPALPSVCSEQRDFKMNCPYANLVLCPKGFLSFTAPACWSATFQWLIFTLSIHFKARRDHQISSSDQ